MHAYKNMPTSIIIRNNKKHVLLIASPKPFLHILTFLNFSDILASFLLIFVCGFAEYDMC